MAMRFERVAKFDTSTGKIFWRYKVETRIFKI